MIAEALGQTTRLRAGGMVDYGRTTELPWSAVSQRDDQLTGRTGLPAHRSDGAASRLIRGLPVTDCAERLRSPPC